MIIEDERKPSKVEPLGSSRTFTRGHPDVENNYHAKELGHKFIIVSMIMYGYF